MQITMRTMFLAAAFVALAIPASAQDKNSAAAAADAKTPAQAGEASRLEKKETGINAEEHQMRQDNGGKLIAGDRRKLRRQQNQLSAQINADKHNARIANDQKTAQPKTELGQRAANPQKRVAAGLKTGQLTSSEAAKIQTRQAALNHEVHTDREENGGKLTPAEKAKVNQQQNKLSNEIHQKKHNARMF